MKTFYALGPLLFLLLPLFLPAQNQADGDQLSRHTAIAPRPDSSPLPLLADLTTLAAGDSIEGDYIGEMRFAPSGNDVWVLHRSTNNISVINWADKSIRENIIVGRTPIDIEFNDTHALVACYQSNELYIIRRSDYGVERIINVGTNPAKLAISESGNTLVIGYETTNTGEAFDLNTYQSISTFSDFPVGISKFSFITSNPRSSLYYSNFRIVDGESKVVNGADEAGLKFWDLATGALLQTIPAAGNSAQVEVSGDGSILVAVRSGNPGLVSQIDIGQQSLLRQVELTDVTIFSTYSPPAVNQDGNKVLVPSNPGNTALVDFNNQNWQHVETGNTPDWVGHSVDRSVFVAGDFNIATISPATGQILSSLSGISIQNGAVGAGNRIVASDPLRYESLVYYDFDNPSSTLTTDGQSSTGSVLEADVTYSTKITPDGRQVLALNSLSGTLSVIDVETETLAAIIPLGGTETYHADVTSDSRYALVAKRLANEVAVIDLERLEVVAELSSGGSRPSQVFILPGDREAYVLNAGGDDNIGVLQLDGAASSFSRTIDTGNTGVSWTNFGIRSDLEFTPDGSFALLANPFDNQVQLIDLGLHQVLKSIPLTGFPLQIAVSDDFGEGAYAAITLKDADQIALLNDDGSDWVLVGTYPCADNPVRIDYDPARRGFRVISTADQLSQFFEIEGQRFSEEKSFLGFPLAVRHANGDRRFILLRSDDTNLMAHHLVVSDSSSNRTHDLPALPSQHFDVSADGALVAVPHPATDQVSLLKSDPLIGVGFQQQLLSLRTQAYQLFPNPVQGNVLHFQLHTGVKSKGDIQFECYDLRGRLVHRERVYAGEGFTIQRLGKWGTGAYQYRLVEDGAAFQVGKLLLF